MLNMLLSWLNKRNDATADTTPADPAAMLHDEDTTAATGQSAEAPAAAASPRQWLMEAVGSIGGEILPLGDDDDDDNNDTDAADDGSESSSDGDRQTGTDAAADDSESEPPLRFRVGERVYIAVFDSVGSGVKLIFPCFVAAGLSDLNEVRFTVNDFNSDSYSMSAISYRVLEASDADEFTMPKVVVSSSRCFTAGIGSDVLSDILGAIVSDASGWKKSFDSLLEMRAGRDPYDFETDMATRLSMESLVRRAECARTEASLRAAAADSASTPPDIEHVSAPMTMGQLIAYGLGIDPAAVEGMTVLTASTDGRGYDVKRLDARSALGFRPGDGMWEENSDGTGVLPVRFVSKRSMAWIDLRDNDDNDTLSRGIVVAMTPAGRDMHRAYLRCAAMLLPTDPLSGVAADSPSAAPATFEAVIGVGGAPVRADRFEAEYMLDDARDKIAAGRRGDLTPEQSLLMRALVSHSPYYLYHGRRHFGDGRWAEALRMLRVAFDDMKRHYSAMDDDARSAYYEVCMMIGLCYMRLRRPQMAHYYMSIASNTGNFTIDKEYINVLMACDDPRASELIGTIISGVEEYRKENETNQGIDDFYDFARRSQATLLISNRRLDDAEALLKQLVNEESCRSFAINHLAYIQSLRARH